MSEKQRTNPYNSDTPEWQLWANMTGALDLAKAHTADGDRAYKLAEAARVKAVKFEEALATLTKHGG